MSDHLTEIKWNIYENPVSFDCVANITIETIRYIDAPEKGQSIQVTYQRKNEDKKTLNIPHYISSFYPVILEDKPRVILHGYFNSNTGDCYYTIATRLIKKHQCSNQKTDDLQQSKKKKSKLATALNLSTLYLFKDIKSISKKVARVAYKPTSISSHVAKDMKSVKPLFSLPDYKKDQAFLDRFTDEQSQKLTRMYTWLTALFLFIPYPYLWYFNLYGQSMGYIFIGIMYFIALIALRARYEAKYKKRTKVFEFVWKLMTWRFM
ncbi:hypothetical protein [Fangia hongkongensis]|uniref:hypothetical protein n=1 Tax=Fangia hongkongensis TaxID=270495 RepID=UPI0003754DAC|nr:hypothetical protein [Fangia hongkongensis]MBK2124439.1 hypothetical protein [Fangia hongkongensis]